MSPLAEQGEIVRILNAVDAKIAIEEARQDALQAARQRFYVQNKIGTDAPMRVLAATPVGQPPSRFSIAEALAKLGRNPHFERLSDRVAINDVVNQEEFSYLLHTQLCPLEVTAIQFENLYRGSIHDNQKNADTLTDNRD